LLCLESSPATSSRGRREPGLSTDATELPGIHSTAAGALSLFHYVASFFASLLGISFRINAFGWDLFNTRNIMFRLLILSFWQIIILEDSILHPLLLHVSWLLMAAGRGWPIDSRSLQVFLRALVFTYGRVFYASLLQSYYSFPAGLCSVFPRAAKYFCIEEDRPSLSAEFLSLLP
jgi:hypothetical protein